MPRDYLPASGADLNLWLVNFTTRLSDFATTVGLTPADSTQLGDAATAFSTALANRQAALTEARSVTARKAVTDSVRSIAKRLQASPAITDANRRTLGLTAAPTAVQSLTAAVTDLAPQVKLDFGTRGQITVHFGPNPANESRNGLPSGASGAII
jgi:hypothetical protein